MNLNLSQKNLIKIALTVAIGFSVCYLLQKYYSKVTSVTTEEFYENHDNQNENHDNDVDLTVDDLHEGELNPLENVAKSIETFANAENQYPKDCFPKDQLSPSELLPGNSNTQFASLNPDAQGELSDQNFLEAGYHTGVNTVGQTLRNANYQVRSEPPNPQVKVSPWLQTTIEPDTNRKPLEIGGACN